MITDPITSPDHLEIRGMVRDFSEATFTSERVRAASATAGGYDEVAWKQMVDLGWSGLGIGADAGGDDLGTVVQCIVHRELGARLAPTPYLASAAFAAVALGTLADPDLSRGVRSEIADGSRSCTVVLGHEHGWPGDGPARITATQEGDRWSLSGGAPLTLDGARADTLIVIAGVGRTGWGIFLVAAEQEGVSRTAVEAVDATRSFADLALDGAVASRMNPADLSTEQVAGLVDRMAVHLAAEMMGAADACMRATLDYLGTREQFGKPIGSFQALKHRCADLAVAITVLQELVFAAAEAADQKNDASLSLAAPLVLARAGEVLRHTTEESIQMHGGVGFTDEYDVGLYYKRALVDSELLATPADAYGRLERVRAEWSA